MGCIETIDNDPAVAVNNNSTQMTAVMAALEGAGVVASDIQTTSYNVWLEQVVDREGQPTGEIRYHVSNQIKVKLTDLGKTGELLAVAAKAGVNTIGSVTFGVSDMASLQAKARDNAIANAQAKAGQLATGFGASLGAIRQVSEFTNTPIQFATAEAPMGVGGGGNVPIQPGSFSVTVDIQAVFDIGG